MRTKNQTLENQNRRIADVFNPSESMIVYPDDCLDLLKSIDRLGQRPVTRTVRRPARSKEISASDMGFFAAHYDKPISFFIPQ